ncbi:HRDC domain-containing protein [Intrasporangium calvum]|uniref:HRDC domain-containing protein n=1 Tax=Intrasporangium calvum TaxID=53358 RepID=A0ABT5GC13_9MICO|nr:HRDC domain-containing protein [Intrasporangium calvum]MDC5695749.1 HRDC domain-containing protein [Intrasporangium calvum]
MTAVPSSSATGTDEAAAPTETPTEIPTEIPTETPIQAADGATHARPLTPLVVPRDGVPEVLTDERSLAQAAEAIAAGSGPIGMDAERASGYRYGQRAYLVQVRRAGAGTFLVDPVALPDLSPLEDAIGDAEWIVHAATQDLVCLAEVGLRPRVLFDTELGGRLAGLPRVGLGAMVEHYLGLQLAKEHSAVDWSVRPLPEPWLRYAALDVEVLVDLRDAVGADLERQGKAGWAAEEFQSLLTFTGPERRVDPWRRTSGIHRIRARRGTAIVRELWLWRDELAQQRDVSPGRIVPDAAIAEIAIAHQRAERAPRSLTSSDPRLARSIRRHQEALLEVLSEALALPEADLPPLALPSTGPPPPRTWADKDPVAAARLARARELLAGLSQELAIPVENVLTPDLLRRYLWDGPPAPTTADVAEALARMGARRWQTSLAAPLIARACSEHPTTS